MPSPLLPVLLFLSLPVPSLSLFSCRSPELEQARLRRIEAVRGQILSKLRLPEPPPEPPPGTRPVPEELRALYNSTRELLRQRGHGDSGDTSDTGNGHGNGPDPEDYLGKELLRFPMIEDIEQGGVPGPSPRSLYFRFDAARVRAGLGGALLSRAELRMLRHGAAVTSSNSDTGTATAGTTTEQRLELYEGSGNSSWRFLQFRSVRVTPEDEWLCFDVTDSVRRWLRGSEPLGVFRVSAHCPCEPGGDGADSTLKITIEGFEQQRGDLQALARRRSRPPHLLTMVLPPERAPSTAEHRERPRRELRGETSCGGSEEQLCCVRPLYIDFRRDLQWKWIHEPRGYMANFCGGPCPYIWSSHTHHSKVLALYNVHNPEASASPCCVPQSLEPLPIIYYVGRRARLEQLPGMVVSACKCS